MRRGLAALLLLLAALSPVPAWAHVVSESNSVWEIDGGNIDLIMTIPDLEAHRLTPSGPPPSDARLKAYLQRRVYPLAQGKPCLLVPPIETMSAVTGFRKFDFTFKCLSQADLQIHSAAFYDLVPSHTNYAQIENCLLYTSPSPRDRTRSRMPSSA